MKIDEKEKLLFFSPYIHLINVKNTLVLYDSLFLKKIIVEDKFKKYFLSLNINKNIPPNLPSEVKKILIRNKFILNKKQIEKIKKEQFSEQRFTRKIKHLYLVITNYCNFACKYCDSNNHVIKNKKYSSLSKIDIKKALEIFIEVADKNAKEWDIQLYGGEPLIEFNNIKYLVELVKEYNKKFNKFKIYLVTNGSLMTTKIADFIVKNKIKITFSFDGNSKSSSICRVDRNGNPTYELTLAGIKKYKEAGGRFGVSLTVNSHNIDVLMDDVKIIVEEIGATSIGLNQLIGISKDSDLYVEPEIFAEKVYNIYKYANKKGVYEWLTDKKIKPFVREEQYCFDCAAYDKELAIGSDGSVGFCHHFLIVNGEIIGNIIDKNIIDKISSGKYYTRWLNRTPFLMEKCKDCIAIGLCGGGCAYNAHVHEGSIYELDKNFCKYSKKTLELMFKDAVSIISGKE